MDRSEIPPYFICPISLQIMKDPVTLSTGVTYDRKSIERWFSSYDHNTCPVTNQPLADRTLTPNSTLLRLIQSWPATSSSSKPLLKPDVDVSVVVGQLFKELKEPSLQIKSLEKIKGLVHDNEEYRFCMEEAGITSLVASIVTKPRLPETSSLLNPSAVIDEATSLLSLLNPSPLTLRKLGELKNGELIGSLSSTIQKGSYRGRIHATLLLKSVFKVVDERYKAEPPADLFDAVVDILKDQNSDRATTLAAISILLEVVPHRGNRVKAIESGVVAVLVELLVEEKDDRRKCEAMLALLAVLCGKAEGRLALLEHPAGVAAVAGKILRVSITATERAVKVLLLVCRFCGGGRVVEEMMVVGGVAKLCMVVQAECNMKTKDMAKEILGLHIKAWNKFPCFSSNIALP